MAARFRVRLTRSREEPVMTMNRRRTALAGGLALHVLTVGFAGGMAAERIRFDRERADVLARYDEAIREWHAILMRVEHAAEAAR
jgi:hypothetical protein